MELCAEQGRKGSLITIAQLCNSTCGMSGMSVSIYGANGNTHTKQGRLRNDGVRLELACTSRLTAPLCFVSH